jgi:hypothetical protein
VKHRLAKASSPLQVCSHNAIEMVNKVESSLDLRNDPDLFRYPLHLRDRLRGSEGVLGQVDGRHAKSPFCEARGLEGDQ